jgi:hypothetical protein
MTGFFGLANAHKDVEVLYQLQSTLKRSKVLLERLTKKSQSELLNAFRFTPTPSLQRVIAEANIELEPGDALEILISSCDDVVEVHSRLATIGVKPTKANVVGMALVHACRIAWWHATGEDAPRYLVKASDLGGDAARNPSRFDNFARDVFGAHGRDPAEIPGAMDAWRRWAATDPQAARQYGVPPKN